MRSIFVLAMLLPLAACGGAGGWSKAGMSNEKAAADYAECRHSAELAHRRDRDIDTDILASRSQDWQRLGLLQIKENNYSDSNSARESDMVSRCMIGKGYTAGD